ncbi:MAG TPA: D-amino acid dehydrogenase [Rhodocyclaceae bacterium]|nr:D-amino acid dehydrogenase [Rhodocyclaceae bacterium]
MRITIVGAGAIGVGSAWYLMEEGHEVTVLERQAEPAAEASHANGGQISVSHAEPWANPAAPLKFLQSLGDEEAPLLWRLRADAAQWLWGLRFLRECTPQRTRANIAAIVRLGLFSRTALQELRQKLTLDYQQLERGILHFYTDPREFDRAVAQAALMRAYGCEREAKTSAECLAIEPALGAAETPLVGGTYTVGDESGDAQLFCKQLAQHAARRGVTFRYGQAVVALERQADRIIGVRLASGEAVRSDHVVVAMGSYSPLLLHPCGVHLPIYPAKGYSATLHLPFGCVAPSVSLTDDGRKLVFSRLGQRLRVAGTAEFNGYDTSLNTARCAAMLQRTLQIFPSLKNVDAIDYWACLRPSTPSNVPYIGDMGKAGLKGLWLNTGHGTLGWTLACGSARLLADRMAGRTSAIDPAPYRWDGR